MRNTHYLIVLLVVAFAISGCHKNPPKTYDDTDMTITYYNSDFNFGAYNTYIMPDSMILKTNYLTDAQVASLYKSGGTSDQALSLLDGRFLELGYSHADSVGNADFIAIPTLLMMKNDQTVTYNPGWWWGYPGYGWGWGYYKSTNYYYGWYPVYPWYPTGVPVTVSTYTGTIVYEMLDAESYRKVIEWNKNNPDPDPNDESPQLEINWQSQIEGYSTDDGSYDKERAVRGTDEAFAQSPYLKK